MSPLRQHTNAMRCTQAQRMGGIHSTFQSVSKRAATVGNRSQRAWDLLPNQGVAGSSPAGRASIIPLPCRTVARADSHRRLADKWSERADSNRRPLDPQSSALPGCATLRPARTGRTPPPPGRTHYSARLQARPTFRVEGRARRGLQRMKGPHSGSADPLTDAEKRFFVQQGFLHVASAVPTSLVRRARRAINHSLGAGIDKRGVARMNARSFCEELVEDPRLLRLATTPRAWSYVRSLVGDRRVERPKECQIALRFPRLEGTPRTLDAPHLDGYHTPYNGIPDDGVLYGVHASARRHAERRG